MQTLVWTGTVTVLPYGSTVESWEQKCYILILYYNLPINVSVNMHLFISIDVFMFIFHFIFALNNLM